MVAMNFARAQESCIIRGRVLDRSTRKGIPFADIVLEGTTAGITSDTLGFFAMPVSVSGKQTLQVTHVGYISASLALDIPADAGRMLEVELLPAVISLKEVVVEQHYPEETYVGNLPYLQYIRTRTDAELRPEKDLGEYLRSINNISCIRKGGTALDPVMRGFRFGQLNIQADGGLKIEGGCPNRMDPATSHMELEDVDEVAVTKGPYTFTRGPVLGGLISLNTGMPEYHPRFTTSIKAVKGYESNGDGNKEYLLLKGGFKQVFYRFSGSRTTQGNYETGAGDRVLSSYEKAGYKLQAGLVSWKNQAIILNYHNTFDRNTRYPSLPMDSREDDAKLASLDYVYENRESCIRKAYVKMYHSGVMHRMDNKERTNADTAVAETKVDAANAGFRAEVLVGAGEGQLTAGFDGERVTKDGARTKYMISQPTLPVKTEQVWKDAEIRNIGAYAEYRRTAGRLDLSASARYDFNTSSSGDILINYGPAVPAYLYGEDSIRAEYGNFSLGLGGVYRIGERLSAGVSLGRGMRSPDATERFIILLPIGYDRFDYLGNPRLEPEVNYQSDITLKYVHPGWGSLLLNGFFSYVENYINGTRLPPALIMPLSSNVIGVKQFQNTRGAFLRGMEFNYTSPPKKACSMKLDAAFTYGTLRESVRYVLDEQGGVVGEETVKNDAVTEIPPFEASLTANIRLIRDKLSSQARTRYVAPQNHVSKSQYERASAAFITADLSMVYTFSPAFSVNFGVSNLFDANYYEHLNRNILGSSGSLYEPGRNFFINLILVL
jgi:iron complex outermembrane receptor protein